MALPKIKIKRKYKFWSPLKKQRRWLSLLGLLIVFCTFLIKDFYRDQLADLRVSVSRQYNLYDLEMKLGSISGKIPEPGFDPGGPRSSEFEAEMEATSESLINASYFLKALPRNEKYKLRLDELNKRFDHATELGLRHINHPDAQARQADITPALMFQILELSRVKDDLVQLSTDMAFYADQVHDETEKGYDR